MHLYKGCLESMRIYLTHCSKEKEPSLEGTDIAVPPDRLYVSPSIQQFMKRCRSKKVSWGVLSDLHGVFLSDECRTWYEKHPDTVTDEEEAHVLESFSDKLSAYAEIFFYVRPSSCHPFYRRILRRTSLADRVQTFQDIGRIK